MATRTEKEAAKHNIDLAKSFGNVCGLAVGFFRIGGAGTLGTDLTDGYTKKEIEKLEREYFGGKWGKPRPDMAGKVRNKK